MAHADEVITPCSGRMIFPNERWPLPEGTFSRIPFQGCRICLGLPKSVELSEYREGVKVDPLVPFLATLILPSPTRGVILAGSSNTHRNTKKHVIFWVVSSGVIFSLYPQSMKL